MSDLIEFLKILQKSLNSPYIRPLFTTMLFNSRLFHKIGEFGINFDMNSGVFNDHINSFCQGSDQRFDQDHPLAINQ